MIGGQDFTIATDAGLPALELALRAAVRLWPRAVFEDVQSADVFERYTMLDLRARNEIFVYKNRKYADKWRREGAVEELTNTMIHLILDDSQLTIVVDSEPSSEMRMYVEGVTQGLRQDIFNITINPPVAA